MYIRVDKPLTESLQNNDGVIEKDFTGETIITIHFEVGEQYINDTPELAEMWRAIKAVGEVIKKRGQLTVEAINFEKP